MEFTRPALSQRAFEVVNIVLSLHILPVRHLFSLACFPRRLVVGVVIMEAGLSSHRNSRSRFCAGCSILE